MLADVRRTGQPDRPGDLRRHVGEDVAVKVRHHDHVECLGRVRQLGRADVDDPVLCSQISGYSAAISSKTLWNRPSVIFMMLSFVKQVTFLRLLRAGVFEGVADDLLAAGPGDQLQALDDLVGLAVLDARRKGPLRSHGR